MAILAEWLVMAALFSEKWPFFPFAENNACSSHLEAQSFCRGDLSKSKRSIMIGLKI
jgi:hypothetical protein